MTVLNLRGVKESVTTIAPIFGVFLLTHVVLLGVTIFGHIDEVGAVSARVRENVDADATSLGVGGLLIVALRAYSLGGGTYTGIEAVSNGMAVMREPRVQTAKRTMLLMDGGWLTVIITTTVVAFCFLVKRHYARVGTAIRNMEVHLPDPHTVPGATERYSLPPSDPAQGEPDPALPVAAIFVGGYGALGRHALTNLIRTLPGHFRDVVFVSIAIVDSDTFKGAKEVEALERKTKESLDAYVRFRRWLGLPSTSAMAVGTEIAVEAEELARGLVALYPKALFVAGQIVFAEDTAWNRLLHNETAFIIQRKLQHEGIPMIVHPVMLDLDRGAAVGAIARSPTAGSVAVGTTSNTSVS